MLLRLLKVCITVIIHTPAIRNVADLCFGRLIVHNLAFRMTFNKIFIKTRACAIESFVIYYKYPAYGRAFKCFRSSVQIIPKYRSDISGFSVQINRNMHHVTIQMVTLHIRTWAHVFIVSNSPKTKKSISKVYTDSLVLTIMMLKWNM